MPAVIWWGLICCEGLLLCAQAANKTLKAMLSNDRGQAAELGLELEEMRGFLLGEQETDAVRFLAVLQASECPSLWNSLTCTDSFFRQSRDPHGACLRLRCCVCHCYLSRYPLGAIRPMGVRYGT